MRVLYILNDTFKRGGTESVVFNYYNHINPHKIKIDFMIHTTKEEIVSNEIYNKLIEAGATVHCVTPRRISIKRNAQELITVFRENQYDIVHSHADCASAFILFIAQMSGVKCRIAHSHSAKIPISIHSLKECLHVLCLNLFRYLVRYTATNYMACSDTSAIWMFGKKRFDMGKVYMLNNAIDLSKYKYSNLVRKEQRMFLGLQNAFVIGHVGRFSDEKNHFFILDVFKEVLLKKSNARLLLVGEGPNFEKVRVKCTELGISDYVMLYGKSDNVSDILNAMDIFILPSTFEGLSVGLVEAQANGLMCVVTDSDKVSKDSCLTKQVQFIPLSKKNNWIEIIVQCDGSRSEDCLNELNTSGYNIVNEAKKLENYYCRMNRE